MYLYRIMQNVEIQTKIYSRFAAVGEEVLQEVCLVELSSSLCTICLLEYYCIVVR